MPNLSVIEAAHVLGLSEDTVRRQIKRGERPEQRDAAGRLRVYFEDDDPRVAAGEIEVTGRSASRRDETPGVVRLLEREREVLVTQLTTLQQSLAAAAEREAALLRALHQQQALQAQAAGLKLLHDPDGATVAEPLATAPRQRWWNR